MGKGDTKVMPLIGNAFFDKYRGAEVYLGLARRMKEW
jgi:hypothetical protein